MNKAVRTGIFFAILAAVLYALNAPFSKIMLGYLPPTLMAGFLYLGAGAGMALAGAVRYVCGGGREERKLTRAEFPYTAAMVLLDIAAPVCLMIGLTVTAAESASLLNNFEIVATAVGAWLCAQDTPLFRRKRQKAEKIQDASQESPPVSEEVPPDAKKS